MKEGGEEDFKRHSLRAMEVSQRSGKTCANCVDPPPSNRGPITVFGQVSHAEPLDGW